MNKTKTKSFHANSARLRYAIRARRKGSGGRPVCRAPKRFPRTLKEAIRPARELMIVLGWLRLFQQIIAPRPAGHSSRE